MLVLVRLGPAGFEGWPSQKASSCDAGAQAVEHFPSQVFKQLNIPLEMDEARYLFEKYDSNQNNKALAWHAPHSPPYRGTAIRV